MITSLLAQLDSEESEVIYEFARLRSIEGWWLWATLISAVFVGVWLVIKLYRRDASELSASVRHTLTGLRLVVFFGLLFLFGDLQRRTERTLTLPSEVALLIDTSQSMSLPAGNAASGVSRQDRINELFESTDLLRTLSEKHRLNIYSFGQESEAKLIQSTGVGVGEGTGDGLLASESGAAPSNDQGEGEGSQTTAQGSQDATPTVVSLLALLGGVMFAIGLVLGAFSFIFGIMQRSSSVGWSLMSSAIMIALGISLTGAVYSVETERSLRSLLTGESQSPAVPLTPNDGSSVRESDSIAESADVSGTPRGKSSVDWKQELAATSPQSRIGDAIGTVLDEHDPATLAGVVLVTDGQNNGGEDVNAALAAARRNEISLYPIGLGSSDAPVNVRVVDLEVPKRVYPGDAFTVTATLQASGPREVTVEVELLDGLDQAQGADGGSGKGERFPKDVIDTQSINLPVDGTLVPVRFEMEPESVGRRRVGIRLLSPSDDQNDRDDRRDSRYEVVAKKLRVLAIAGGPTREYRFVRNLYFRDRSIELDVWLQTGQVGMSQDANQLLDQFPESAEKLFDYDVIAMFDPDWTALTLAELGLLERWVSQQAGGLILVAGPVYHPKWTRLRTDPRVPTIAGLFPVTFSTRGAVVSSGRQGGETAWPLDLTQEAQRAEFLWVDGDAEASQRVWGSFSGVYDYVDTKDAKPGSKVYAYFSDPTSQTGGTLPVYLASQFYGAGRTFFQASGEMWRLRGEGDQYFQSYFTKLARWVSEGRLLRDSNRGVLLLDANTAMIGDSITVRAVLSDEQFEPLNVEEVAAKVFLPDGKIQDLRLLPLQGEPRAGTYGGQFVVRDSGDHEVRLAIGDALNEQLLQQVVRVRLPTQELERPRRNDDVLNRLARLTSGSYLPVDDGVSSESISDEITTQIQPQPQETILPGTYEAAFTVRRNAVLMWLLATMLTMEWVIRRLHRLA